MSYVTMDHAGWVERNNAAGKTMLPKSQAKTGKGFAACPDKLSPFQASVFDILGMTFGGIYNTRISWAAVEWHCGSGIGIPMRSHSLSTFDFQEMTSLVFLCHEARIRCEVSSYGVGGLMLMFHPRVSTGDMARRHPNLDEAVARFRDYLPADHRIIYREPAPAEIAEAA